jgi:AcrR family transcriptional regulator
MSEQETRQKILEGALKVFSVHGYHKASIKKIAKAAEIKSSALIYHYFEDKKALFNAIVRELSPARDLPILNSEIAEQAMNIPPEIVLNQIGNGVLSLLDDPEMTNIVKLFLSEAARMPEVALSLIETQQQMLGFLIRYFQHHIDNGTFREHDVEVSARAFVGMIMVNILATLVFTPLGKDVPKSDIYVREIVNIFLNGMKRNP